MTSIEVRLYLLVTFNDFVSTLKNSKIWIRVFKIITKARRHMCSLYAYITSLQHNIISNFFVMKYNLPTNWLFLLSMEIRWKYVSYNSFLLWFINRFLYNTLVFLSFLSAYTLSLHCVSTVRCMVNFRPMHS